MRRSVAAVASLALVGFMLQAWAADFTAPEQRGKQFYREGISANGRSVTANVGQGSLPLSAEKVPCASCHGRDGLGRPEAGVVPSNITWANLTKPYGLRHDNGRSHPPYTADAIITAVTRGIDPANNVLDPAMPRYSLDEAVARDLVAYLQRLGTDPDQDIPSSEIIVATVVPADGPLVGISNLVTRVLIGYFDRLNQQGGVYNRRIVLQTAAYERSGSAVAALRRLTTETQVFAVVAPVLFGQEAAFAAFADSTALPVIGPFAQDQRGSPNHGGFSFYLTAGPEEQARALVTYAQTTLALANPRIAIVSSRDGSAPAVADSIRQHCRTIGWTPTASLDLSVGAAIADVASQLQGSAIDTIFYDGDPPTLGALFKATAGSTWRPVFLTTGLSVTPEILLRQREAGVNLFVAYPLLGTDLSPDALAQLQSLQAAYQIPSQHVPTQIAALVAARVLVEGLQRSGRDLNQTKFVTALASLQDYKTGLMPAISFGPNRRTGVLGAYIIAVAGANSKPVWVPLR